jgi:hypothetical protein
MKVTCLYRRKDNWELIEREWEEDDYRDDEGDVFFPYWITTEDGVRAEQDIIEQNKRRNEGNVRGNYPMTTLAYNRPLPSLAASLPNPGQAKKFNEDARADGIVGVNYDMETGQCTFESRGARNAELTRRGIFDKDAGYGDKAD